MPESDVSQTSSGVKQGVKKKIGPKFELPSNKKRDLKIAFNLFDKDGFGYIEVKDLKVAIRALGYEPGKEEIMALMSTIEKPREGKISLSDFIKLMTLKMTEKDSLGDLMKSFRLLDRQGKDTITFNNLKDVAQELNGNLNDEQLQEMIEFVDTDGDGAVSMNDYLIFMGRCSLRGEF